MRKESSGQLVVVGVDGSVLSLDAVAWAAREAELRNEPLLLVHAYVWPLLNVPTFLAGLGPTNGLRDHAKQIVDEALRAAHTAAPGVEVRSHTQTNFPLPLLVELSRQASYVVVGSRGLGIFGSLVAGSTTVDLIARAHAPVVITHGLPRRENGAPVVLGVDGSPENAEAIGVAFDAAAMHQRPLVAIHVVRSEDHSTGRRNGEVAAGAELLRRTVSAWLEKYPSVAADQEVHTGHPGGVLAERSRTAFVTVVGSRGRGGFKGMLLGSVSQALTHHAQSPLIVVPSGDGS